MERACDFGGDCGMAYFCPLFPLAQIAERIRFVIGNVFGIENDGDGYTPEDGDCDDDNADVNPGAEETPGDGVDSNCDGEDDT